MQHPKIWNLKNSLNSVMEKTEEFLINRLIWKAEQYKLPTKFSIFFKDLSSDIQSYLASVIDFSLSGAPVLYFTKPTKEWTLICTHQIISSDNEIVSKINIDNIQKILPTGFEELDTKPRISINNAKQKSEWHKLTITDKQNNSYVLHAYTGADLFSLWNILLMAKRFYD